MHENSHRGQQHFNAGIQPDDSFLWDNLRQGNKEAFEVIYRKHVNQLYNYGIHIFLDKALVEDAIQDVFVGVWKRRAFLGETDSIRFYLCKSLKREIVRKIRLQEKILGRDQRSHQAGESICDSIEVELISRQVSVENVQTLSKAIESLPERQRDIIIHRFYENLSAEQISSKMSLSIDSTYTLLSRAVKALRKNVKRICILLIIIPFV